MCGRYLIISSPEAIRQFFRYPELPNFPARYNVAPTQPIPIVRLVEGQRQFALAEGSLGTRQIALGHCGIGRCR